MDAFDEYKSAKLKCSVEGGNFGAYPIRKGDRLTAFTMELGAPSVYFKD